MDPPPPVLNPPREQHVVQAVGPVPLCLVEGGPLLHQELQVLGVHLQPADQVVHVAVVVLAVKVTAGGREGEGREEGRDGERGDKESRGGKIERGE